MQLEFDAEQEQLRAAVREVLDAECAPVVVRERVEKGTPATALWDRAVELGWPALTLPENVGGLGLGPVEAALVAEELGRHAAPLPWLSTVTQYAALVARAGTAEQRQTLLAPVADGSVTGTVAVAEDAVRALPAIPAVTARRDGDGWRLDGVKRFVWDASAADEVAVVATVGGGLGVFVVRRDDADVRPLSTVDASREWADVHLDGVRVDGARALGEPGGSADAVRRALAEATVAVAAEIVGACDALLDRTLAYVRARTQFGVPIGSFQALKHMLADSYVALERARAAAYFAAATLAEDDARQATAVPMAKLAAGDCQRRVVHDAIQCHGGIGYTWESDVQLWAKRAQADDAVFGTAREQRRGLAALLGLAAPSA